jgi:hypothetical protein
VSETQQLYEIADIAPREVDESLLILPAGFVAAGVPGERPLVGGDSIVAKWRVAPGVRSR